jgi:hypothetical protein
MFIELTNSNPDIKGQKIAINTDMILSVREGVIKRQDESSEYVTMVYCPPHGTWEVEETLDDVMKIINKNKVIDLN